ncbi:MAG: hypothetical protein JW801_16020 [Bacteroidales bacterium]|nr:hypothetical protein [Bacteroidales bacterium]
MKTNNSILLTKSKPFSGDDALYFKYLNNQSFRGFYYDTDDRSYGIALEFGKNLKGTLNLFAQVMQGNMNIIEYQIRCNAFSVDTLAYDKVLINSKNYSGKLQLPNNGTLDIPEVLEFSVQILTRNSVYIRFLNHEAFTPPISSFKGGLVLAREHRASQIEEEPYSVESDFFISKA